MARPKKIKPVEPVAPQIREEDEVNFVIQTCNTPGFSIIMAYLGALRENRINIAKRGITGDESLKNIGIIEGIDLVCEQIKRLRIVDTAKKSEPFIGDE